MKLKKYSLVVDHGGRHVELRIRGDVRPVFAGAKPPAHGGDLVLYRREGDGYDLVEVARKPGRRAE